LLNPSLHSSILAYHHSPMLTMDKRYDRFSEGSITSINQKGIVPMSTWEYSKKRLRNE
jgi:hypothetical protein